MSICLSVFTLSLAPDSLSLSLRQVMVDLAPPAVGTPSKAMAYVQISRVQKASGLLVLSSFKKSISKMGCLRLGKLRRRFRLRNRTRRFFVSNGFVLSLFPSHAPPFPLNRSNTLPLNFSTWPKSDVSMRSSSTWRKGGGSQRQGNLDLSPLCFEDSKVD